jgi:hypothetical protein
MDSQPLDELTPEQRVLYAVLKARVATHVANLLRHPVLDERYDGLGKIEGAQTELIERDLARRFNGQFYDIPWTEREELECGAGLD